MNRSMKKVILVIGIWTSLVSQLRGQAPTGPQTVTRDATAIQLLTTALNQAGGAAAWQSIHGSRVKGKLTAKMRTNSGETEVSNSIVWLDDWSTGHPRYNRATTNSTGATHTLKHSDKASFTAHYKGQAHVVKQFDTTNVLLTHLPAAALAKVLSDSSYAIAAISQAKDQDHDNVMVSKPDGSAIQIWSLNKKTGRVDAVRYAVPDALNPSHHAWDLAIYDHYRSEGALSVPDKVTIIWPNSMPIKLEFSSLEANPGVSDSDFESGSAQ